MRLGVFVEGRRDVPVFEALIPKVEPAVTKVVVRSSSRGKSKFMSTFPDLVWTFQHVEPGGPADKVIVVCDANSEDATEVEAHMRRRVVGRQYPFPRGLEFHATRRETETWLLADINAMNRVARDHGMREVTHVPGPLENVADAKERFIELLSRAGLPDAPEIVREITQQIDLDVLREYCPSFRLFESKVRV